MHEKPEEEKDFSSLLAFTNMWWVGRIFDVITIIRPSTVAGLLILHWIIVSLRMPDINPHDSPRHHVMVP